MTQPIFKTDLIKVIQGLQQALGMPVDFVGALSRWPKPRLQTYCQELKLKHHQRYGKTPLPKPMEETKPVFLSWGDGDPEPFQLRKSLDGRSIQIRMIERQASWFDLQIPLNQVNALIRELRKLSDSQDPS